jgi:hypothetical protein
MVSTDLSVGLQGQAAFPAARSGARSAHHGKPPLAELRLPIQRCLTTRRGCSNDATIMLLV